MFLLQLSVLPPCQLSLCPFYTLKHIPNLSFHPQVCVHRVQGVNTPPSETGGVSKSSPCLCFLSLGITGHHDGLVKGHNERGQLSLVCQGVVSSLGLRNMVATGLLFRFICIYVCWCMYVYMCTTCIHCPKGQKKASDLLEAEPQV